MLLPLRLPLPASVTECLPAGITVGARVGAGRIPYGHAHPDCWRTPWAGTLLAIDDVEVWKGTMAFSDAEPEQLAVSAHVLECLGRGLLKNRVPVRWDFGKVLWERPETLRTVEADVAAFVSERDAARR